jgi:PAS domain S-box-containing protein
VEPGPSIWPAGGGAMGALIRTHDWAATPLGPLETWPQCLRTIVEVVLASGFPMVARWGPGLVQIYNDAFREIMGGKHPAGLGQPTRECWPEVWHISEPIYARALAGETLTFEDKLYLIARHGEVEQAWFTLSYSPLRDESGFVAGVLVTAVETTRRHLAEAARDLSERTLRESEEHYRSLVQASDTGYCVIEVKVEPGRPPDYRFIEVNPAFETHSGLFDAKGRWAREAIPGLEESWFEIYGEVALTGRAVHFERRAESLGNRWFDVYAFRIGAPARRRLGVLFTDISARKGAEERLRASEARLKTAIDLVRMGLYSWEPESGALDWDARTREMWGLPPDQPVDIGLALSLLHPEDRPKIEALIAGATPEASPYGIDYRVVRPGGEERWLWTHGRIFFETDKPAYFMGALIDTTDEKRAEEKLRRSEQTYRTLFESMDEGYCVVEAIHRQPGEWRDFRYVEANPAFARHTGLADVLGKTMIEIVPFVLSDWFDIYDRVLDTGEPIRFEREFAPIGRVLDLYVYPIGDPALRRLAILFTDITARKQAEAELRQSEERLRRTLEIDTVGVVFLKLQEGVIADANAGFLRMTGFSREEVIGLGWRELSPKEFLPVGEQAAEELRTTGRAQPREKQYFRKDGSCWWGLFAGRRLDENEVVVFVLDASERRKAEQAHAESEARLRSLMEGIPQLVWRAADGGAWTWSSPQWSHYTGLSEEVSQGFGWLDAVHPADREAAMQAWRETGARGSFEAEYRIGHVGEGRYRWFQTRAMPVRDDAGSIVEWLGTTTDIDDLRRLQDQQEVMVGELQHRTRNLIAMVRSIAGQTIATSESLEGFRTRFNNRLAALSRVQSLLSRSETITIGTLVRMEIDALGADSMGDRVVLDGPEAPLRNSAIQTFALALHELATNARKYGALASEEGRLEVTWRVREEDGEEPRLRLDWVELGIDPNRRGPTGRGYGRDLIERALPYTLQAETRFELDETSLRCRIELPLKAHGQTGCG